MISQRHDRKRSDRAAFTLMEVLVVVAILVVLAGIGIVVFRYLEESKDNIAKLGMKNLEKAIGAYKLSHGDYPENLQILTMPQDGKPAYLDEGALLDPWSRPYVYEHGTRNPRTGTPLIYSQGGNPGNPQS